MNLFKRLFGTGENKFPPSKETIDKIREVKLERIENNPKDKIEKEEWITPSEFRELNRKSTTDKKPRKKKEGLSPIQKRLLKHFALGKSLSIRNMWQVRITNPAREVARNFSEPFGIEVNKKRIEWNENGEHGFYFEYAVQLCDIPKLLELCKLHNIQL